MRKLVLAVACTFFFSGCDADKNIVAKVNGREIQQAEFDAYLTFKNIPKDDKQRTKAALDDYIERESLASVIEQQKKLDQHLIQVEVNEFRKQMLISRYFDEVLRERVNDTAVQKYYADNAAKYQEEKVHVAHVLIRTRQGMSDVERQAALTKAQEAYSQIKSGQDFATIAQNYSEDKVSSGKGGDLGWIKKDAIAPAFSQKVFALKPGEVSEPFATDFGYHVAKLIEGPQVVKQSLEAVKGDISYQLRQEEKQKEIARLKAEYKVSR